MSVEEFDCNVILAIEHKIQGGARMASHKRVRAIGVVTSSSSSQTALTVAVIPKPVVAAPVVTAVATPPWISGLTDSSLKSDITTILNSGTCTQAQMTLVFEDLVAEVQSGTVTSSQLSDLKTIAANLGALGASSYVQYITNALVNGNIDNATWTGGGSAVKLGNLAAGSSATVLSELSDKWFLGADDPSKTVSMSGSASFTVTYKASADPLYGAGGPAMSDINQGDLGDCYLLSSLAEVANQDPNAILSMITDNGNSTYGVRFNFGGAVYYVTVDNTLPDGGAVFNNSPNIWASIVEKAFAEWAGEYALNGWTSYNNSFTTIGNGGDPAYALEAITGATSIRDIYANGSSWISYTMNNRLNWTGVWASETNAALLSDIAASLAVGDDVELSSYTNATSGGKITLVADHAMSIYGFDAATNMVEIRNPWGTSGGSSVDTTFEISLQTLLSAGDIIAIDNAGTATSVTGASVAASSALQSMSKVKSFSVSDTAADIAAGLSSLKAETKLSSLTVTGTSGADTFNLTGLTAAATVNLGTDAGRATVTGLKATAAGLDSATSLNLGAASAYDMLTLGSGAATVDYTLGTGVLDVANFSAAHDLLSINLNGGSLMQTILGGGDWISSTADPTQGVYLAGITSAQKVTLGNGMATVA